MKIMGLDILTLERLREYTEPSNVKENLDFSTIETLRESIEKNSPKIKELVILECDNSTVLLTIKNGKYYNYFTEVEVFLYTTQISRMYLIAEYTKKDS